MTVAIEVGRELDRAVADAIGLVYAHRRHLDKSTREILGGEKVGWWDGDKYVGHDTPAFSTDLNAAFAAAEKVGLFEDYVLRQHSNGLWAMCIGVEDDGRVEYINFTPNGYATPALAICAAILKLKESE